MLPANLPKRRQPSPPGDVSARQWGLLLFEGNALKGVVPLGRERLLLGRDPTCGARLDDIAVSRQHCAFERDQRGVWLEDLHSMNGTYCQGVRVERALLQEGSEAVIGNAMVKVVDLARSEWTVHDDLFEQLYIDSPSGLLNSRGFWSRAETCFRVVRSATAISMIAGTLDGRSEGRFEDGGSIHASIASHVGRVVRAFFPTVAICGWLAREEFAILLPSVGPDDVSQLARNLLKGVSQAPGASRFPCGASISLGVAFANEFDLDVRSMYLRADTARFRARARGGGSYALAE